MLDTCWTHLGVLMVFYWTRFSVLDTVRLLPPSVLSALATFRHSSRNISRCHLNTSNSNLYFKDRFWAVGHFFKCVRYALGVLDTVSLLPLALARVRAGDLPALIQDNKQVSCTLLGCVRHVLDTPRGAVDTPGVCWTHLGCG